MTVRAGERLSTLARRVVARMTRARRARDLDEELAFHRELLARDLRADGMSDAQASDASARRLGNRTKIIESSWDSLGLGAVDTCLREMRFAIRAINKSAGFALTVVLTLALGIGATVTTFTVVDHVLLRPLPYPTADRLVELFERGEEGNWRLASYPTSQDWSRSKSGFAGISYIRGNGVVLEVAQGRKKVAAGFVSPGFFSLIGSKPELGRFFAPDEELPSGPSVVVLSHALWLKAFDSDPYIIGKAITVDRNRAIVVGVMPATFAIPFWAELWEPLGQILDKDPVLRSRDFHSDSRVVARLSSDVDSSQATRLLSAQQRLIAQAYPQAEGSWSSVFVDPLRDSVIGDVSAPLWALGAAVALMLLIACMNLANLVAVRGASRAREVAVRLSLGAGRVQVARQLFIEILLLAVTGGAIGVLGSYVAVGWLRVTAPFDLPRASELAIDWRSLLPAVAITVLTAIFLCVLPAMAAAMPRHARSELLGSRSGNVGSTRESRGRAFFIAVQFALALVLLIGSGLLIQSYRHLQAVNLGFDAREVFSLTGSPPKPGYARAQEALALYLRLIDRLRAIPGVEDAAVVNFAPTGAAGLDTKIEVPGRESGSDDLGTYLTVTEGYLRTMRIPLLRGRWFSPDEVRSPSDGIVISESVAKKYWPGSNAVGKSLTIFRSSQDRPDFGKAAPSVVIGIVGDVRESGPENKPDGAVYVPLSAEPWPWASLVVRARSSNPNLAAELGRAVVEIEPRFTGDGQRFGRQFEPLANSLSIALAPRRYVMGLVGAFSLCAMLLAGIGIFGVTSYTVNRTIRELGVRLALGAEQRTILRTVFMRGMVPAIVGCALGLGASFALTRLIAHLLFDTSAIDPEVFAATALLLLIVGMIACYLPARRASRVDPMIALRSD